MQLIMESSLGILTENIIQHFLRISLKKNVGYSILCYHAFMQVEYIPALLIFISEFVQLYIHRLCG